MLRSDSQWWVWFCSTIEDSPAKHTHVTSKDCQNLLLKSKGQTILGQIWCFFTDRIRALVRAQAKPEADTQHTVLRTMQFKQLHDMLRAGGMNQTAQRWVMKNSLGCSMQTHILLDCHDTDTGRRWHHYLECLHLLAWGRHHWRICLQLHSRHCALCLQVGQ